MNAAGLDGGDAQSPALDSGEGEPEPEDAAASTDEDATGSAPGDDAGSADSQVEPLDAAGMNEDAAPLDAGSVEGDAAPNPAQDAALDAATDAGVTDSAHGDAAPDGASEPALCPASTGFTPRALVIETFELPPHLLGQEALSPVNLPPENQLLREWEEPATIGSARVDGNVLLYTFSTRITPFNMFNQPIAQQTRCGVGIAEWDGSDWHEVFRELYVHDCSDLDLDGDRAVVFTNGGVRPIERGAQGRWQSQSGFPALRGAELDGDRLFYLSTEIEPGTGLLSLVTRRRSATGWDIVQSFPHWSSPLEAHDGILRGLKTVIDGDAGWRYVPTFYRWSGSAYVTDEALSVAAPAAWTGDSFVKGDCADGSSAAGVCADPGATGAAGSGAVRLFGDAVEQRPEGLFFKASNPEAGDQFCEPTLRDGMLAVWAAGEDSAATGIDGDQASNANPDSGALYLFLRDAQGWNQHHYIKLAAGVSIASFSSQRIALVDTAQNRVVLYRYAEPPAPTYVHRRPCEGEDGQPLPEGTLCLRRDEPPQLCEAPALCISRSAEHPTRSYQRWCSGTSRDCDGSHRMDEVWQYNCTSLNWFSCQCGGYQIGEDGRISCW